MLNNINKSVNQLVMIGIALGCIGALTTLVPFIGIAELARVLISSSTIEHQTLVFLGSIVALGLMLGWGCSGAALWVTHIADHRLQTELRRALVSRLGKVPLGWYSDKNSGAVRKAVEDDLNELHHLVAHHYVELSGAIALPIGGILYLIWLDWRLAILALITLPIYLVAYIWMMRGFAHKMELLDQSFAQVSEAVIELIQGITVTKVFGQTGSAHTRYQKATKSFHGRYDRWARPFLRIEALTSMALSVPVIALVSLSGGSWMVQKGWITPIELLAELLVAMVIPQTLNTFTQSLSAQRKAKAASQRVVALLNAPELPISKHPKIPENARICFDQVSFSFDQKTPVLNNINLVCQPGTVTALVGPSGAGKSTLAKLVPRFYDVTDGAIRLGGVDLRDIDPNELYRHVGFVLQDAQLLQGTVRDNLKLGHPNATQSEVEEAACLARIHDCIMALPRGYDSVIDEDAYFSGGEAQRLSIARILLADTPVIILDEATAHADPESEAEVQQALTEVARGRTILVIAHRLPTIKNADQIIVLDNGSISERGCHETLVSHQGLYQKMWATFSNQSSSNESFSSTSFHHQANLPVTDIRTSSCSRI